MKDNNDEFVLEQTTEVTKPNVLKKRSKRKQNNKQGGKPSRCNYTVDFVEEQTGDKYKKTKRSY